MRREVYLKMEYTIFKLQLKPPLTIPDLFENFRLNEVLPNVPPVVLLDIGTMVDNLGTLVYL